MGMTLTILGVSLVVTIAISVVFRWHQIRSSDASGESPDVSGLPQYTSSWVGVIYAMTLGLAIVGAWDSWSSAHASVRDEASALRSVAISAGSFPPQSRDRINHQLSEYATEVVQNEWRLMAREGAMSVQAGHRLSELRETYANVKPRTAYQEKAQQVGMDGIDEAAAARQTRSDVLRSKLDPLVWLGLLAGAGLVMAFTFSYPATRGWGQTLMVTAMAGMMAFMIMVIYFMDSPFTAGMRVSNGPFVEFI